MTASFLSPVRTTMSQSLGLEKGISLKVRREPTDEEARDLIKVRVMGVDRQEMDLVPRLIQLSWS